MLTVHIAAKLGALPQFLFLFFKVKRKMTKADYIRMNRGINESKDLPNEYLEDIFDQIKRKEIALKPTRGTTSHRVSVKGTLYFKKYCGNTRTLFF